MSSAVIAVIVGFVLIVYSYALFTAGFLSATAKEIGWKDTMSAFWWGLTHPFISLNLMTSTQCMDECGGHFDGQPNRFCVCQGKVGHRGEHYCQHGITWGDDDE